MADIARLGLAVDSSQVEKGTVSLHQLTGAAGQASAAAQRLAGTSQAEATGQKVATTAVQAHTAALAVQNNVMRSTAQQRTIMVYQLNDVAVSLASGMNPAMVAMQQGSQILQGGLMPAVRTLTDMAKGMLATFWPVLAVVGAVSLAVAGLTHEINETAAVQVGFFDVALAGWQLFAEGVAALVAPVFGAIGGWLQQGWDAAVPILKAIGNVIIGTFVGSFEAIKAVWSNLPAALGDWAYQAAQVVADAFTTMGQNVIISINQTINAINEKLGSSMPTLGIPYKVMPGAVVGNPYAGSGEKLTSGVSDAFGGAMSTDYMGDAFGAISGRAQEIAAARKETEGLGGAAAAANDNVKMLADDGFGSAKTAIQSFADAARSAFSNMGTGLIDAFKKGGDVAGNVLSMLMDKVGQLGESLLNSGLNGLMDMGLNALFGGLTGGFGAGGAGFLGGGESSWGSLIPGFANGTSSAPGGLAWVGEQGPELVNLPRNSQVIPNSQSMAMAANSNSGSGDLIINNTINVPAGTSADVAPAIAREVTKELKRQLPDAIQAHNRNPLRRAS